MSNSLRPRDFAFLVLVVRPGCRVLAALALLLAMETDLLADAAISSVRAAAAAESRSSNFDSAPSSAMNLNSVELVDDAADVPADGTLDLDWLIREVQERNPSVQAAVEALQAASEVAQQRRALDDPMFSAMVAPDSFNSDEVKAGYAFQASQKIPWPGKRGLRGTIAMHEAQATAAQIDSVRLDLRRMAQEAYADYFLASKRLALNEDTHQILVGFRDTAAAKYRANLVTQQDTLQADVELASVDQTRLDIERDLSNARTRINTLLHADTGAALPPPPSALPSAPALPSIEQLLPRAIEARPELAALRSEILANNAQVLLARREFRPDVTVVGRYDRFWQENPLRSAAGVDIEVPLYRAKRWAAVREACARLRERQSRLAYQVDQVEQEVRQARDTLIASQRALALIDERLAPLAERSVQSARESYTAAKIDFLRLLDAQRQLLMVRERRYEAEADILRRHAELDRAVGEGSG